MPACSELDPAPRVMADGHMVACHLYEGSKPESGCF
jgi:hypothetical protein